MPLFTRLAHRPVSATVGAVGAIVLAQLVIGSATASSVGTGLAATVRTGLAAAVGGTAYLDAVAADGPSNLWRLNDSAAGTSQDFAGTDNLTVDASATRGAAGPLTTEASSGTTFSGAGTVPAVTSRAIAGPQTFSVEAWFRTTSTTGGKIIGFGSSRTANSTDYDRHLYLTNSGNLTFGVYPGGYRSVSSQSSYNNGQWHHVVGALNGVGMELFVDGRRVGTDTSTAGAERFSGYWRVGGDNLTGWPGSPSTSSFAGSLADVAVYPSALTLTDVQSHYQASGRTADRAAAPADAYGAAVYGAAPSFYWRLDESSGTRAKDEISGDPQSGTYSAGTLLGQPGSSAAPTGKAVQFSGTGIQTLVSNVQVANPTVYSLETWFRTTSSQGGRLIGFGSAHSGYSTVNYDRQITMLDTGQLQYGIFSGSALTMQSPLSYNDGNWHHVVATQSAAGGQIFVDGARVATGTAGTPRPYTGYWRLGTDHTWSGASSDSFAGWLDEAAVYPTVLPASTVLEHYTLGAPAPANVPPTAAPAADCTDLDCAFDGTGSVDPDGAIASYAWSFGDGRAGTADHGTHSYAAAGSYTLTLTVTDTAGATDSAGVVVTATAPNQPPVAAFSSTVANLSVSFDAGGSIDPDGAIASYAWDFGDDSTDAAVAPTHRYAAAGSYPVTLTVTDDDGGTDTFTATVTATDRVVAADTFSRTVASGLGWAETGGAWSVTGSGVSTSVTEGSGRIVVLPARTNTFKLASASALDTDLVHTLWLEQSPSGAGATLSTTVRSTSSGDYRLKLKVAPVGTMTSQLVKVVGSTETALTVLTTVPGGPLAVNQRIRIRVQAFGAGPTTVRARIWPAAAAEPQTWPAAGTDSTPALQVPGSIGLVSNLLGNFDNSVIRIDDLLATERTELEAENGQ
jgi:trimeric autotransporter adhesin